MAHVFVTYLIRDLNVRVNLLYTQSSSYDIPPTIYFPSFIRF